MEIGIFIEALWHDCGGFGDISKEYTDTGSAKIFFLMFFIPVSIFVIIFPLMLSALKPKIYAKKFKYVVY